jgi:hypothetical protein
MNPKDPVETKKEKKMAMIAKIMAASDTLTLFTPRGKYSSDRLPNNTYFMSYHLYQGRQENFKEELDNDFGGDIKKYIQHLVKKYPYL